MREWLIVADDVTGALDSAVGFAGTGLVEYGVHAAAAADVAATSTGSRADPHPPIRLPARAVDDRFERLFVKIDSTLRGWPAEHVAAALAAWHPGATAIVCPAAPALGRSVVGGTLLVDGQPATRSAAGADPVAPVREDRLPVLFGAPLITTADISAAIGRVPVVVVDAATPADLAAIAAVLDAAGPRAVPVGSGGLATALGDRRSRQVASAPSAGRILVLATSVHPVSRGQIDGLGGRWPVIVPPPLETARVRHDEAAAAARAAADEAARRIADGQADAVIVIGGDGTDALLTALNALGVEVLGSVLPGVPWGRIRGGSADGLLVLTKSGGFGDARALTDITRILTEETP